MTGVKSLVVESVDLQSSHQIERSGKFASILLENQNFSVVSFVLITEFEFP